MAITPQPPTLITVTPHSYTVTFAEDGNAAALYTWDILTSYVAAGGLVTFPFYTNLVTAFPAQADARLGFRTSYTTRLRMLAAAIGGGGTAYPELIIDQNIAGGVVAGNFRLEVSSVKTNALNTGSWILVIQFRHSIVQ